MRFKQPHTLSTIHGSVANRNPDVSRCAGSESPFRQCGNGGVVKNPMAGRTQNIYPQHRTVRADDKLKVTVAMKTFRPGDHGNLGHYRIQQARITVSIPMGARRGGKKMRYRDQHQNDTAHFSEWGHVSDRRSRKPPPMASSKRRSCSPDLTS